MTKFSGKRYFYWIGGNDKRKGFPMRSREALSDWAWKAYLYGYYDHESLITKSH